ncbi:MAG: RNA-binding S4 domain-containing protein [Gammaproteobacteria bacterium]
MGSTGTDEFVRLDLWLWAARLFKTRRLATEAVSGGRVHLDGEPAKPGKRLHGGERLSVTKGEERLELTVRALSARRGPAAVARTLYEESEASIAAREVQREQRRLQPRTAPVKRPQKHDRRRLSALKRGRD